MKFLGLVLMVAASAAFAASTTFDFEGITVADLVTAGWEFEDGGTADTIVIETTNVKNGSAALRMGWRDWASFDTGGKFGTLDLWIYDAGYLTEAYYPSGSAYGPTWGLQKDLTGSWTYPGSTSNDYVYPYGIGAGLVQKTFLPSDAGYAEAHGQDLPMPQILQDIVDQDVIDGDPLTFTEQEILDTQAILHYGWGRQSWFSPAFLGGASPALNWLRAPGWCHFQIKYVENGLVEIYLLENGDASNTATAIYDVDDPAGTPPGGAFDGTHEGGVDRLFIWGGSTEMPGMGISEWDDIIIDDVIWTPEDSQCGPGDVDCDGDVDISDFLILKGNYGTETDATWGMGDMDGDEDVDITDFLILKSNYGNVYTY